MEGVDIVRQAAEECALELEGQTQLEAIDDATMKELLEPLPDYQTEVLEEGDAPLGPGEYPGGIPPSPPRPVQYTCPIHAFPLEFRISEAKGWEYYVCGERGCPVWLDARQCQELCEAWEEQVCPEIKRGPFTCYCRRPYKWVLCRTSQRGNQGRLFLTCRDRTCDFFQWADTPPGEYRIDASYPGQTRRRQILAREYARPVRPRYVPESRSRDSALTMRQKVKAQGEKRRRMEPSLPTPPQTKKMRHEGHYHPYARMHAAPPPQSDGWSGQRKTTQKRTDCDCYPGMHASQDPTPRERVEEDKERVRREKYLEEEMYLAGLGEEEKTYSARDASDRCDPRGLASVCLDAHGR